MSLKSAHQQCSQFAKFPRAATISAAGKLAVPTSDPEILKAFEDNRRIGAALGTAGTVGVLFSSWVMTNSCGCAEVVVVLVVVVVVVISLSVETCGPFDSRPLSSYFVLPQYMGYNLRSWRRYKISCGLLTGHDTSSAKVLHPVHLHRLSALPSVLPSLVVSPP